MKSSAVFIILFLLTINCHAQKTTSWIRINLLGYTPQGEKVAVWCSKENKAITTFQLVNDWGEIVFTGEAGKPFGAYGPFQQSYRLDFSAFRTPGRYSIRAGGERSEWVHIRRDVYNGAANFCLRYMRQQRTGFNPYLNDSCHTRDGYVLYGQGAGIPDSTYIDVVGGWHDASDYLQYSATSANAIYHLLMAYRVYPESFLDEYQANGLKGKNGIPDVMDEARWGLDWLLKMHPRDDWMFNQIADDRDHRGMRMPKLDSFYGRGHERPVYFLSGEPQQQGKFMNKTTGRSSTAGKFSSAFSLGAMLFSRSDTAYANLLKRKARSALQFAYSIPGVSQTASVVSPYIYAEENYHDDLELANVAYGKINGSRMEPGLNNSMDRFGMAFLHASQERITPWLGSDTAKHYQWYPFINIGHYELAKELKGSERDSVISWYREGIRMVWEKARKNAFYRGVPFIWCSNNLTVAFAMQCMWYKELTGDNTYSQLEQANFDWLFGCNPWGTIMVYGLHGSSVITDTPVDPHSAFTHIKRYPIDGGLVDGPVYGSIFRNLIGIQLKDADEYEEFQSDLAVYHDDYGDYSTNEPTMDGTASLVYLLAAREAESARENKTFDHGAIIRGDSTRNVISLVFTADEYTEGAEFIRQTLAKYGVEASFFFTGRAYRNEKLSSVIKKLKDDGHYLGAHSDQHLLYCNWSKRDSLLVSLDSFRNDLLENYEAMEQFGITREDAPYFLPPYEWHNEEVAKWTEEMGLKLINMTPGTRSHADYTTPGMKNYIDCDKILKSIKDREAKTANGLNGYILLMHLGSDPARTDKCYNKLPDLLKFLKSKRYHIWTVEKMLSNSSVLTSLGLRDPRY